MKLTVWTYEGPPHVGAMRVVTGMRKVHYVLHAPQGDTYADLLFTMIERRSVRPPVTYTTFQARDLGGDTAELFKRAATEAWQRFQPDALLVGSSCTAELIQDDPGGLAQAIGLPVPVIALELPSYQKKENWGAAETFYQLVRGCIPRHQQQAGKAGRDARRAAALATRQAGGQAHRPSCNLLGACGLGYRHRDDVIEVSRLLAQLGIDVAVVAPAGAEPADLARLPEADFNVVLYPETAETAANWLERTFGQPRTRCVPIGVGATRDFVREVAALAHVDATAMLADDASRLPWYARSVDSGYLTGKRVFIFGDATHVMSAARIARDEIGFEVVGMGTYSREFARPLRALAEQFGLEALISDDYLEVEAQVEALRPDLVLGTQMERHVAKRLGLPCAVISAPVHVQDFPARYAPQMGYEGANVIFDTWVQPLMMGLEEHLLHMFREDFEFHADAPASHLGARMQAEPIARPVDADAVDPVQAHPSLQPAETAVMQAGAAPVVAAATAILSAAPSAPSLLAAASGEAAATPAAWAADAERELGRIPFFVRGRARRNTERFAAERGVPLITVETLYEAKAHFSR